MSDDLKLIARKIKEIRMQRNITISELSLKTGLSETLLKQIEDGNYDFQLKEFKKICLAIGIKIEIE